jgi:hypothetical protein
MGPTFLPDRCAYIDTVGTNYLIRGNMPLVGEDQHYAYKEIGKASGLNLTGKRFVEIPIIDNVGEREQFVALMRAFSVDPDQYPSSFWPWWTQPNYYANELHGRNLTTEGVTVPGGVLWRPFEGLPEGADPKTFLKAPGWDYAGFISQVVIMLASSEDTVFYVHCQLGADRTGAFHIGYLMKAKGFSFSDAWFTANAATSAGPPNADYERLVRAYAHMLGK